MATTYNVSTHPSSTYDSADRLAARRDVRIRDGARLLVAPGRILFALIFMLSALNHFSDATINYAAQSGVPAPGLLVPLSGIMALIGGLMIAVGYHGRIGALLLILFLLPVSFAMHDFWTLADPMERMNQRAHFLKNMSMLGGALLIAYFGSGPTSLDARER